MGDAYSQEVAVRVPAILLGVVRLVRDTANLCISRAKEVFNYVIQEFLRLDWCSCARSSRLLSQGSYVPCRPGTRCCPGDPQSLAHVSWRMVLLIRNGRPCVLHDLITQ